MKTYWPIFFLIAMICFQMYVASWNKNKSNTFSSNTNEHKPLSSTTYYPSQQSPQCLLDFLYPHVIKKENQSGSFLAETADPPFQVVDWYKEKLQNESFDLTTDVVNTTNGTSSNMLVGKKPSQEISIVIGKGEQEAYTTIFIHFHCQ